MFDSKEPLAEHKIGRRPIVYKQIDFGLSGTVSGSGRPGDIITRSTIPKLIQDLKSLTTTPQDPIFNKLKANLDFFYHKEIRVIYGLISPPDALIKYFWEQFYPDCTYINEVKNINSAINEVSVLSTAMDNQAHPTSDQLQSITCDIIARLNKGENVLVHCDGGMGRTGTILTSIYMKIHKIHNEKIAIKYISDHYFVDAIDSPAQIEALQSFGRAIKDEISSTQKIIHQELYSQTLELFICEQPSDSYGNINGKGATPNQDKPFLGYRTKTLDFAMGALIGQLATMVIKYIDDHITDKNQNKSFSYYLPTTAEILPFFIFPLVVSSLPNEVALVNKIIITKMLSDVVTYNISDMDPSAYATSMLSYVGATIASFVAIALLQQTEFHQNHPFATGVIVPATPALIKLCYHAGSIIFSNIIAGEDSSALEVNGLGA